MFPVTWKGAKSIKRLEDASTIKAQDDVSTVQKRATDGCPHDIS